MSEAFNNVILSARVKLVITMLKDIRTCIMERCPKNKLHIVSFQGSIYPKNCK